ncbi:cyclin-H-like [Lineus longissimus]|uniref:cyclin-H-like n=1 Tax=Lineus longissimus TaxID=88925 RepID=UPI002B4E102F
MFPTSSQVKFWMFADDKEILCLRKEANERFIKEHGKSKSAEERQEFFLTTAEERSLQRHYEYILKEFCARFQPPMPRAVVGCSMAYFKRVYIHNSLMDYHPREMMLTCVYLACKVEEFNVSINQFVANLKGDRERFADLIVSCELMLMHHLHYHLTMHSPYRPFEGLMIDMKTRCKSITDVEKIRKGADDFMDRSLNTDAMLLFSPSQIALAAILHSASRLQQNLDKYVTETLLGPVDNDKIKKTIEQIKRVRYMIRNQEPLNREFVRNIEKKLEKCRNQENNPSSEVYKRKMEEKWDDEVERQTRKRQKTSEEEQRLDEEIIGT